MMKDSARNWPDLKTVGHIKGRLATEEDIKAGNAVFVLQSDADPLNIEVPQYALHLNKASKTETPGVIIQGEETAQGQKIIGFLPLGSSKFLAALFHEFELLGTRKPRKKAPKKIKTQWP
jgi:hypothetical protein